MTPASPRSRIRILIADDEENTRMVLGRAMELSGYETATARDGQETLALLERGSTDLLLLDLRMPGIDGEQVMQSIADRYPNLSVIVLTAHASLDSAITAVKAGATDYLLKPQSIPEIQAAIERALRKCAVRNQKRHLIGIISNSLQSFQSEDRVNRNIVISAETGLLQSSSAAVNLDPNKHIFTLYPGTASERRSPLLTINQVALLSYLILHHDSAVGYLELTESALGYHGLSEKEAVSIIRPHIVRLRKKIEPDPLHPKLVQTVRGKGYLFCPPEPPTDIVLGNHSFRPAVFESG